MTRRSQRKTWINKEEKPCIGIAVRHHPALRSFYQRLRAKAKPVKVALIAAMRKLLIILNALLRPLYFAPTHG